MTDRLIRITTALAVATVVAVISYQHSSGWVSTHSETGVTARLVPQPWTGILAASMLILDANRRGNPVQALARWCLGAPPRRCYLAHDLDHGQLNSVDSGGCLAQRVVGQSVAQAGNRL